LVWELVFMMVVLKIPILYLCAVVWWAVRAEPRPLEGAALTVAEPPGGDPSFRGRRSRPRIGPGGGPARRYARVGRPAIARAEARR
jgi:hypothetical protein